MKATAMAVLLTLAGTLAAAPKAVPLEVSGDTVTVVVVKSFGDPVKVKAGIGGDKAAYVWKYPDSFTADPPAGDFTASGTLTIKLAPKGTHKISVSSLAWGKDGSPLIDSGTVTITVGDVPAPGPGPTPPGPQPPPEDELTKAMRAAYAADTDAAKATLVASLASLLRVAAEDGLPDAATAGALFTKLQEARRKLKIADGDILATRKVVQSELAKVLPDDPDERLSVDVRTKFKSLCAKLAAALDTILKGGR